MAAFVLASPKKKPTPDWKGCAARPRKRAGAVAEPWKAGLHKKAGPKKEKIKKLSAFD